MRTNYLLLNNESNEEFYSDDKPFILYLTQSPCIQCKVSYNDFWLKIVQLNRLIIYYILLQYEGSYRG